MKKVIRPIFFGLFILGFMGCGKSKSYTKTLYIVNNKNKYEPCKKLVFYSEKPNRIEWAIKELGIKSNDRIKVQNSCQSAIKYTCENVDVTGAPGYYKILNRGVTFKMSLLFNNFDLSSNFMETVKNKCLVQFGGTFKKVD